MGSKVAVLGASGFAGAELLRLISAHPGMDMVAAGASSRVGVSLGEFYPQLPPYREMSFVSVGEAIATEPDLVFSSLPHTHSMKLFGGYEGRVVDLAGDFRLHDAEIYPEWYGEAHFAPEALSDWVYGLTELHRDEISTAEKVANPGCYAAAALLALAPLFSENLVESNSVHIDGKSGVSGAGRASGEGFDFISVNENLRPYTIT
jgi:N-acetyl-gamma-glutamyl-phosphate reductase